MSLAAFKIIALIHNHSHDSCTIDHNSTSWYSNIVKIGWLVRNLLIYYEAPNIDRHNSNFNLDSKQSTSSSSNGREMLCFKLSTESWAYFYKHVTRPLNSRLNWTARLQISLNTTKWRTHSSWIKLLNTV